MSKAALDHFTKTMATNLMTEGVRVNSINPATVRTDIHYQKGKTYRLNRKNFFSFLKYSIQDIMTSKWRITTAKLPKNSLLVA